MLDDSIYAKRIWWTIAIIALIRIVYVVIFPFDLSGDEAYYWDWGRQLSWGYFSKPPFIAWTMAFAGWLGGNSDTGIRLMAVALGTGSLVFVYLLTRRLWNNKAAFWAVALTAASPGNVAVNLILTIDAPLMFFWIGALYFFYNQIHNERLHGVWLLLTTLFLGLGILSKQMMFVFIPFAATYLAINPDLRKHFKDWKLWTSWLVSIAFIIPTLIWNSKNDWITISHTQHHFEGKPISFVDIISRVGEYFGTQLVLLSPVTGMAVAILIIVGIRSFKRMDSRANYLLVFSAPGLVFVCLMLIRQSINPNWPAVFYVAILILLAGAISGEKSLANLWKGSWEKWKYPSMITGIVFAVLVMVTPFVLDWTKQTGSKFDPVVRLEGWSEFADAVQKSRELNSSRLNDPFILAAGHRYAASHLAFYLVDQPRVYHWPETPGTIESQYELWGFPPSLNGKDAFIVVPGKEEEIPDTLTHVFDSIEKIDDLAIERSAKRTRYYTLYIGKSLKLNKSDFKN